MLCAEQMNLKPSINLSRHAGSTGNVLEAGPTGDAKVVFFLVGGISDKSLFEIDSKISSSLMLMRMNPLPTLLYKIWLEHKPKIGVVIIMDEALLYKLMQIKWANAGIWDLG